MNSSVTFCDLILVAGGSGSRFGGNLPKQFEDLNGRPLYLWSLDVFLSWPRIGRISLVVPAEWAAPVEKSLSILPAIENIRVVVGGKTRQASASLGLLALAGSSNNWVMVHDAARPAISTEFIERIWLSREILPDLAGVVPGLSPSETVKRVDSDGTVNLTLPREELRLIQTPQLFKKDILARAYKGAGEQTAPDDAFLVEKAGLRVLTVDGEPQNIKITFAEDKDRVSRWLRDRHPQI